MLYILIAILMFGILIALHEFGHFAAAKLCGVKVNEFAIGMGPKILHWIYPSCPAHWGVLRHGGRGGRGVP